MRAALSHNGGNYCGVDVMSHDTVTLEVSTNGEPLVQVDVRVVTGRVDFVMVSGVRPGLVGIDPDGFPERQAAAEPVDVLAVLRRDVALLKRAVDALQRAEQGRELADVNAANC